MSIHNVRDFGAVGDGRTLDTKAIQAAIDAGGITLLPPGTYLSGTVYLRSGTVLQLEPGAILKGSGNFDDYNAPDVCFQNMVSEAEHTNGKHLVMAVGCENIRICGGGRIDGSLNCWFNEIGDVLKGTTYESWAMPEKRPSQMVFFCECKNIHVENVELFNSPYWTLLFYGCTDVYVTGVKIRNPFYGHNGDGIGLDCVRNAVVSNCDIQGSDDCITLRSCSAKLRREAHCENITVTNCLLSTRQAGIRIGLGNGTRIRNAVFSNIVVRKGMFGVVLNASWTRDPGSHISNIMFTNMTICAHRPIIVTNSMSEKEEVGNGTISGVTFSHIRAEGTYPCGVTGYASRYINDVVFQDIVFDYPDRDGVGLWYSFPGARSPLVFRHVKDLTLDSVRIRRNMKWKEGAEFQDCPGTLMNLCRLDDVSALPETPVELFCEEGGGIFANFFRGPEDAVSASEK